MFSTALWSLPAIILVALLLGGDHLVAAKKLSEATKDNCEVCVSFMEKFIAGLDDATKSAPVKIENAFRKTCKTAKKSDQRLCYFIGGSEDSATSIIGELSKPVSWSMPADKVCLKLYKKDNQICDLKYEKQIDLSSTDLKKLKVRDLKKILTEWEEDCKGCTEKSDFIRRIEELMPKYAPRKQEL